MRRHLDRDDILAKQGISKISLPGVTKSYSGRQNFENHQYGMSEERRLWDGGNIFSRNRPDSLQLLYSSEKRDHPAGC